MIPTRLSRKGLARWRVVTGTRHLWSVELALAAGNAGPELVQRLGPRATLEAIDYVASVKSHYVGAMKVLRGV